MKRILLISTICMSFGVVRLFSQGDCLVNTSESPFVSIFPVEMNDVQWTNGFWAERFAVCEENMVPHMMDMYLNDSISHGFANFEIAAELKKGEHVGPPFHDGDFYKILEALIVVQATNIDKELERQIDSIIAIIGKTQRADGYIHTPVVIEQNKDTSGKKEFGERLDFETYNLGHLMTVACIHYRLTGKTNFLDIAKKATDFLYRYYKEKPGELAQNAICPSHYMGVAEMYRTTHDSNYYELAKGLIDIRSMVKDGTDHNQDRIPLRQQTTAVGHAVRANYLYAGAADVYAETGDDSLLMALQSIWNDLVTKKLYITGACGALYDGVSPNGTTYNPSEIQQVHQAYGQDYQLPNMGAHNESCANIGNLLWNWRMLQLTADAKYADIMEEVLYNSLLAGVSLDGLGYFYTNPLAVSRDLPYTLRWSKEREGYISYCNCCPPNTIRTIAEINNYMYSLSELGIWLNFYGANTLSTTLKDGSEVQLEQVTDYPWEGKIMVKLKKVPRKEFSLFLRIPGWCDGAEIYVNGTKQMFTSEKNKYMEISRKWKKDDIVILNLPMEPMLILANPLIEEDRNQVAIQRGPVVYCLESVDIPTGYLLQDILIPSDIGLVPQKEMIGTSTIYSLQGQALAVHNNWNGALYRKLNSSEEKVNIKLIPYYAWGNRGKGDMGVWLPLAR
jgi:uncharacterized protein